MLGTMILLSTAFAQGHKPGKLKVKVSLPEAYAFVNENVVGLATGLFALLRANIR
jgi:hypothetical protein